MRLIDADEAAATAKRLGMEVPWSTRTVLLLLDATPTITQFTVEAIPNNPLALEKLREMGGEPYWHVGLRDDSAPPHWSILDPYFAKHIEYYGYGKRWLAYRRKPEEGTI